MYRLNVLNDNKRSRHRYVTYIILMLIIQSGFRNFAVGDDTYAYYLAFESVQNTTWTEIFQNFYDVYVIGEGKDAGYDFLVKLFSSVFPSFRLFLVAIAICFFCPLYRLIEKELSSIKDIFFSFVIYQTLFYSFFSITGLRQTIATIATILSINYIKRKQLLRFLLLILAASIVHKSVLIFIPFYFIANIKNSNKVLITSLVVMPLIFPYMRTLAELLVSILGFDNYIDYLNPDDAVSGAINFAVFMMLTAILVLFAKKYKSTSIPNYLVIATAIAILCTPLTWINPSLMRVVQYFSIFLIIALPLAVRNLGVDKSLSNLIYIGILLLLLLTIIRRGAEYAFFWQEMMLGTNY